MRWQIAVRHLVRKENQYIKINAVLKLVSWKVLEIQYNVRQWRIEWMNETAWKELVQNSKPLLVITIKHHQVTIVFPHETPQCSLPSEWSLSAARGSYNPSKNPSREDGNNSRGLPQKTIERLKHPHPFYAAENSLPLFSSPLPSLASFLLPRAFAGIPLLPCAYVPLPRHWALWCSYRYLSSCCLSGRLCIELICWSSSNSLGEGFWRNN